MADPQEGTPDASSALPKGSMGSVEPGGASSSNEPARYRADRNLPVVIAPRLDGSDTIIPPAVEAFVEMSRASAREEDDSLSDDEPVATAPVPPAPASWRSRFGLLAAGFMLAVGLGSFAGSWSASGWAHLWEPAPAQTPVRQAGAGDASMLQAARVEIAALKASLDSATRSAASQFGRIADRLDRVERGGNEPAAKIAHIAESVDRLEKKSTAMATALEATGTIGTSEAARTDAKITDRMLEGWVVQDVRRGHALVESRYGGVFVVAAGGVLPGLGRVEAIKRQDGQWVVITAHGTITSGQ
jgi:hypothetical protein